MFFSKRCPICGVNNPKERKVCKSCGATFYDRRSKENHDLSSDGFILDTREDEEDFIWECEECGGEVTEFDKSCPKCGIAFEEE